MSMNLGFMDTYLQEHIAELQNEVERDRLAGQATPPGQPIRLRLAYRLHSLAEWVEGQPRFANA